MNEWMHFALVFDTDDSPRRAIWYANGVKFYNKSMDGGDHGANEYFSFNAFGPGGGTSSYNYTQSFKGDLAMIQVYKKKLTQGDVTNVYEAHKTRFQGTTGNTSNRTCGSCSGDTYAQPATWTPAWQERFATRAPTSFPTAATPRIGL